MEEEVVADTIGPDTFRLIIPCGEVWVPTPPEAEAWATEEIIEVLAIAMQPLTQTKISNWRGDQKPKTTSSPPNMPRTTSGGTFGGENNRRSIDKNSSGFRRMSSRDVRNQ